jgi:hypothetical protein
MVATEGAQILVRRKLGRVNEYRHNDAIGAVLRRTRQREVPGMQRAHGRHQRNFTTPRAEIRDRALERRQGADDARVTFRPRRRFSHDIAVGVAARTHFACSCVRRVVND